MSPNKCSCSGLDGCLAQPGQSSVEWLGTPVVPFCHLYSGVSFLKLNSREKGTLIIHGLVGNLDGSVKTARSMWQQYWWQHTRATQV